MTLTAVKSQATKREHRRVFDHMMDPPRDIEVEYDGAVYCRRTWQSGRSFGWGPWERVW